MAIQRAPIDCAPPSWELSVLVIDLAQVAEQIDEVLSGAGHRVNWCPDLETALVALRDPGHDVVVAPARSADDLDDLLDQIGAARRETHVVLLADVARTDEAIAATRAGADYLPIKPGCRDLLGPIGAVVRRREARRARRSVEGHESIFLGDSPLIKKLRRSLGGATDARLVVICGEPGSGKKTAARALHALGPRSQRPLISVDAASVERGEIRELISRADRGVLLIARIEDLARPDELAAAIASGADVAVIATTCRERGPAGVEALADRRVEVPPLRARRDDLPLLANHFSRRLWPEGEPPRLSADAWSTLAARDFAGNVAELEQVIARALERCDGTVVTPGDLSGASVVRRTRRASPASTGLLSWLRPGRWLEPALLVGWGR